MSWDLIPEIFFDVIGRVLPGSLLVLTTLMVGLGPDRSIECILLNSPTMNASSLLLFAIGAYFVAIVMKQVWESLEAVRSRIMEESTAEMKESTADQRIDIYKIARSQPAEASKLLKIQAEKNFCEVLIAGLSMLLPINFCLWWSDPQSYFNERIYLLGAMVLSILSCWRWRTSLEKLYQSERTAVQSDHD